MHEVLIADSGLQDLAFLLGRRCRDVRVVLVSDRMDAHGVLAAALAERPAAVHLLAHGEPGRVLLGADPIDAVSLLDRHWPAAPGTEILIHACRVGEGAAGRAFLDRLAYATGGTVAAATHPVGHMALGGQWELDATTGPVRLSAPFVGHEAWPHLLAAITGTAGADTLTGTAGDDIISGLDGDDVLSGDAGNDVLHGGAGADVFYGGDGYMDEVNYIRSDAAPVLINLGDLGANQGDAAGDSYYDVELFVVGDGDDTLIGDENRNWFRGHAGNDIESGAGGDDLLEGGDGDDTLHGGDGNDVLYGRDQSDALYGDAGNDTLVGGGGHEFMDGGDGDDVLVGDWEADTMVGGDGNDTFYSGENAAGAWAEQQNDSIDGGAGDDRFVVVAQPDAGTVTFNGGTGTDTLEITSDPYTTPDWKVITPTAIDITGMTLTGVERLELTGSAPHDVTMTAAQAIGFDSIAGVANGDVFHITGLNLSGSVGTGDGSTVGASQVQVEAVGGNTVLHIGLDSVAGADATVTIAGTFAASRFALDGTDITVQAGSSEPPPPPPATLSIAATDADTLEGNGGTTAYTFTVTRSATTGAASVDYAVSGAAVSAGDFGGALPGGSVSFADGEASKVITVAVSGDTDVEDDEGFTVTLSNASGATLATATAQGTIRNDDSASSGTGGDTGGGTGGGSSGGGDTGGGNGGDGGGGSTPTPPTEPTVPAAPDATLGSPADDVLTGGAGNDILYGDAGNDSVTAGLGDDVLYGNQGMDVLYGNQGQDTLFGGQDADTVFGGQDADAIYGNMANDELYGNMASDTLFGGQGDDSLFGGQGDDVVAGNLGDDVLNGNLGNDTLIGGAGADRFVFATGGGADTIGDFDVAQGDRIQVQAGMTWTISDGPNGAVISFGTGDQITLTGISATTITSDWIVTS
ncbi:MAG TPA: DUF4347 domain-containing protein [Azospirillum sp.]|nr:DUF4347 domain-containing protein [Azospirillum sp.]